MASRNELNEDLLARLNSMHKLTEITEEVASLQAQGIIGKDVADENPTPVTEFLEQIDRELHTALADVKSLYGDK